MGGAHLYLEVKKMRTLGILFVAILMAGCASNRSQYNAWQEGVGLGNAQSGGCGIAASVMMDKRSVFDFSVLRSYVKFSDEEIKIGFFRQASCIPKREMW